MSKNLRVFFLSVLAVLLVASSSMAALTELTIGNGVSLDVASKKLTISADGYYNLPNSYDGQIVSIDELVLTESADEVEVRLPAPYYSVPGEGIPGKWKITVPAGDSTTRRILTINKMGSTAAAIVLSGDYSNDINFWSVQPYTDINMNVPLRAVDGNTHFAVSIDIQANGKFTFGSNSNVYGKGGLVANGFSGLRSAITVEPKGIFEVQATSTLQGSLDVYVKAGDTASNNGRLVINTSGSTHYLEGAMLYIDGTIDVRKDLRIADGTETSGGIAVESADNYVTKRGAATLTLGSGILSTDIRHMLIEQGTLHFDGTAAYSNRNSTTPSTYPTFPNASVDFIVSGDSSASPVLMLDTMTVQQGEEDGNGVFFDLRGYGKLRVASHAVYATDLIHGDKLFKEIYPYENYYTKDNNMRIDISSVDAAIGANATLQIDGIQAFNQLTGTGTIEVNGEAGSDNGVVIFIGEKEGDTPKVFEFAGTITGTNANIGLWRGVFSSDVFMSADIEKADNLLVYGNSDNNTTLYVSGDTLVKLANVSNVYLRSDRPGADNSNANIRSTMLVIGKIIFTGRPNDGLYDSKGNELRETIDEYTLNSLRVDATHVENGAGLVDTDGDYRIVNLQKVELYANKATDFSGDFKPLDTGADGMYAIRLGGAHSKINWNSDGITGDGDAADVDKVFAIQILESADVRMTGKAQYPFARNNSVLVKSDAKLEVGPDTIIDGNLTLEPSTNGEISTGWTTAADPHDEPDNLAYPREAYFSPNTTTTINGVTVPSKWNSPRLNPFTVFTTRISAKNRRTNNGVYAVKVNGDITLSADTTIGYDSPSAVYPGKIVVRAKPDLDLLDGVDYTTGQITNIGERFKVLGLLNASDTYTPDFVPVYNAIYGFRIPRDTNVDGVIFELRKDVEILKLDTWEFTDKYNNGTDFGIGTIDGYNFEIQIKYRSNITYEPAEADTRYKAIRVYFGEYKEGIEDRFGQTNILDEDNGWFATGGTGSAPITVNVSNDITFLARNDGFAGTDDKGQYGTITLMGTSYQEVVRLVVAIADVNSTAVTSQYVVPSYKVYTFVRKGATPPSDEALQRSSSLVTTVNSTLVEGETEKAEFRVAGMRKAPNTTTASPVLVGDTYVWKYGDVNDVYVMKDSSGQDARVNDVKIVLYDGYYYMVGTTSHDIASFDFEYDVAKDRATIGVPVNLLRGTDGKYNAFKQLAVMGTRVDGNGAIITNPATFTLFAAPSSGTTEVSELDSTIDQYAAEDVQRVYDINYTDLGIGLESADKINLMLLDEQPDWFKWEGANDTIAYTIDRTVIQAEPTKYRGTYTFRVLAYVGDNATTNTHSKVYTFKVTIGGYPVITVSPATYSIETNQKQLDAITITLEGTDGQNVNTLRIYPVDAAPDTLVMTSERARDQMGYYVNIVGNGSVKLPVNAASADAGSYRYHVDAEGRAWAIYYDSALERNVEASADFTVTVTVKPDASVTINEEENQFSTNSLGYTYHAVFSAAAEDFEGTAPEIEWSVSTLPEGLYSFTSTDVDDEGNTRKLFVVEGVIRGTVDDTKTFTVNAKAGSVDAEPYVVEYTIDADPYAEEVTYPNVEGITITGDSTAVTTGYRAMLPARTASTSDTDVTLPSWLKPVYDEDENIIGVEFAGVTGNLANGSTATVRIYAEYTPDEDEELDEDDDGYRYYGWDVTYAARPADLALTLSSTNVSLLPGGSQTVTATVTNAQGTVTYKLADGAPEWVTINAATGVVSVTAPADEGTYTVTVIAQDSRGADGQAAAELTITVSDEIEPPVGQDFMLTSTGSTTLSVALNATNTSITLTPRNVNGTVTYTPSVTWVTVNSSTGVVTINPTDASLVGTTQTVTITAKDSGAHASGKDTDSVTLTITVTSDESSVGQDLMLTASGDTRITVALNTVNTSLTLVPRNVVGTVTYSSSADWVDVDEDGNVSIYPTEASLVSTTAHSVTITATDSAAHANGGSNTATITLTITVTNRRTVGSSGGGGCDAGFGALALVLAAPLFLRRRRS